MTSEADRGFVRQALALAALGRGTTRPNPQVGCVIVRDGIVVGSGYHRAAGLPHAEGEALGQAGARARGATLYVNLEPCAHHGRTPPCVGHIVEAGIRRVVASMTDPNRAVRGRGFDALRTAGIELDVGVLAEEATELNRVFIHWHTTGRPWVTLKAAISLDGRLAARQGRSRWISSAASRRVAHRLRRVHDAVLIGGGTLRRDDPRLNVRLPGPAGQPTVPVILSASLDLEPGSRVFSVHPQVLVYGAQDAEAERIAALQGRADVTLLRAVDGRLEVSAMLEDLGRRGIQSLLVEGGGRTHGAFLAAGLAKELVLFQAPIVIGASGTTPWADGLTCEDPASAWRVEGLRRFPIEDDTMLVGRIEDRSCSPG